MPLHFHDFKKEPATSEQVWTLENFPLPAEIWEPIEVKLDQDEAVMQMDSDVKKPLL